MATVIKLLIMYITIAEEYLLLINGLRDKILPAGRHDIVSSLQTSLKISCDRLMVIIMYCLFSSNTWANDFLILSVQNQAGDAVEDVVISAYRQNAEVNLAVAVQEVKVIDQVDKEFIAHVLPIQLGTAISFPNHDQIRHHVYSFSQTKKFEIPLYEGVPANPILFDKVGVVSLGCNIHDWMSAYIYVVDTPYFTTTNADGQASLQLPFGDYEIRYWHPNIDKKSENTYQTIKFNAELKQTISVELAIKKVWSFRRGPFSSSHQGRYR